MATSAPCDKSHADGVDPLIKSYDPDNITLPAKGECTDFESESLSSNVETIENDSKALSAHITSVEQECTTLSEECQSEEQVQSKGLTKRQLKNLVKKQRWEDNKLSKRAGERARKKERRKAAREQGVDLGPSRKSLKKVTMAGSSCHQRIVIDCSFDDLMNERDVANVVRQINHCYAGNRRTQNPVQFYVTGVEKKMKTRLDSLSDVGFWDVNFREQSYLDLFPVPELVYLSSDSDNVLETLDEQKVYVIGGLIDHNHHKGLCLKLANEKGLSHAKLPISDYVHFSTRKVLTINQVFEILVGFTEKKDWEYAFLKAIPKRKEATAKRKAPDGACSISSENKKPEFCSSPNNETEQEVNDNFKESPLEPCEEGSSVNSKTNTEGACSDSSTLPCDNKNGDGENKSDMDVGACDNTCGDMQDNVSVTDSKQFTDT